ncbi:MAG: CopG family transcriptional regulator [Luteolibacter sp.]
MKRTQIQLPDELYVRAKSFAARRELSLAEVTRRGLELFLDRFPDSDDEVSGWTLPSVDCGGIKVSLADLRGAAADEEMGRGIGR